MGTPATARRASASDDETVESKPGAVPEDLDYYDGLLGEQPGADKAMASGKGEPGSTSDYPIPLPSYLLLALATVLSIAFTGSIFEVTGGHPEVCFTYLHVDYLLYIDAGSRGRSFLFHTAIHTAVLRLSFFRLAALISFMKRGHIPIE